VTTAAPRAGCYDLRFRAGYPMSEPAEVALEDYARSLTRAEGAEAMRATDDPAMVVAVHVCGLAVSLTPALLTDVEDFARGLVVQAGSGGLGWS
jgi:hypothetical protein